MSQGHSWFVRINKDGKRYYKSFGDDVIAAERYAEGLVKQGIHAYVYLSYNYKWMNGGHHSRVIEVGKAMGATA